jgi:hypothetical protein
MCKPIIRCSRCEEEFCNGLEYRWHYDKHLDEWWAAEDKQQYIIETTTKRHEKTTYSFWQSIRRRLVGR